jgi:hypothetical protein
MLSGEAATAESGVRMDAPAVPIGGGLILVGVVCIAACVLTLRRHGLALWAGVAGLVMFVAGGLVNGTLLYGSPRAAGTIGNVVYAAVTLTMLRLATRGSGMPH